MDVEPSESGNSGLEQIELKYQLDFKRSLGEIYTRLDNARKLGVDIKPHKSTPSKFRQETYASKEKIDSLSDDAKRLIDFTRDMGKIKITPMDHIGYLDPETKGVKLLASLKSDGTSSGLVGGDIKIDFLDEEGTQISAFFLEKNGHLFYDIRLRFPEKGDTRGLTYRSNGIMEEMREEDHAILSYSVAKASRHLSESITA